MVPGRRDRGAQCDEPHCVHTVPFLSTSHDLSSADLSLWLEAANGVPGARQRLVERTWLACEARLRRFNAEDRDELKQCMAASVLRALATGLVPQHNLDAMLAWRGRAEITAFVRRSIRDRRVVRVDTALEQAGHEVTPYDLIAADELRRAMDACIERIPNRDQRESLRRRLIDGLSSIEIARLQATKVARVRVWIARASALVRACLEQRLDRSGGSS
jgi:RNA polymerase sigma factor (sigma-70 family)